MQLAVLGRRNGDETRHLQRDRKDKTQVIVGVLPDQVHAARRT